MNSSTRVLHIAPAIFGPDGGIVGGAERYVVELARYMADEVPTRLVSFGDRDREESLGNLQIRVIGGPWYVRGQRANPLSLHILRELWNADVVHCHQQHVAVSSLAAVASRALRRKVFVSDLGGGGWDVSAYVSTDRWYHGHLHISEYSRKFYGHADNPSAHVIFGGVDTEKFAPDPGVVPDRAVVFVGRLLPHKGVNDLIDAVPAGMNLKIIGQAYDARFYEDLVARARGKDVTFIHDLDDNALVDAYRRAMCVVLPSVYRDLYRNETPIPELLGQTLLEGMSCGLPAICTDVASMPEVVADGVCGFVVPPNSPDAIRDKLYWLREHPREAQTMGHAGRSRVLDKFTWPKVVKHCLDIYSA